MFEKFDTDDSGTVDFDELLLAVKGEMSPFRKDLVKRVYKKLDYNDNGVVEVDDVKHFYNAKNHPEVRKGRKTE